MAKERKPGSGRKASERPKNHQIAYRIDGATLEATEKMRQKLGILTFSVSDTAREMHLRMLKQEGLL